MNWGRMFCHWTCNSGGGSQPFSSRYMVSTRMPNVLLTLSLYRSLKTGSSWSVPCRPHELFGTFHMTKPKTTECVKSSIMYTTEYSLTLLPRSMTSLNTTVMQQNLKRSRQTFIHTPKSITVVMRTAKYHSAVLKRCPMLVKSSTWPRQQHSTIQFHLTTLSSSGY